MRFNINLILLFQILKFLKSLATVHSSSSKKTDSQVLIVYSSSFNKTHFLLQTYAIQLQYSLSQNFLLTNNFK